MSQTVQQVTLVINTNQSANVTDSALNFKANDGGNNLQNLINWLTGIAGGAYGNILVTATLADNTTVVWGYPTTGAVVSATPTLSVTPTITITASSTPTVTPTPTLTVTPTPTR